LAGARRIPVTAKALINQSSHRSKIAAGKGERLLLLSISEAHTAIRFHPRKAGILAAKNRVMRDIKLSGREAAVVRAIGFAESMLGAEILDSTRMELEDVGDTLNGLIAAGFIETIPYAEQIDLAEMPTTAFEVNPAYVHELRVAISRR
jgi:hypothetical protein